MPSHFLSLPYIKIYIDHIVLYVIPAQLLTAWMRHLPSSHHELDVIALIGAWRFTEHPGVPEMHQRLLARGLAISQREVTHLMQRYEELVTLRVTDRERIKARLQKQGHVMLATDGLQPDVGHEVLCK